MDQLCSDCIPEETPMFTKYMASYDARFKTFTTWPIQIKQTPEELASAGFYYTGNSDKVVCFACNLRLKEWTTADHPFREHQQWSPECKFIHMVGTTPVTSITPSVRPASY